MSPDFPVLTGSRIRLEPLELHHAHALAASAADPSLYQWSPVPQASDAARAYIETALAGREAGAALTFATVRIAADFIPRDSYRYSIVAAERAEVKQRLQQRLRTAG